jgi:lysozyme family protein
MTFDECFAALVAHEGDFADLENDAGGKTRFGVTEAVARAAGYAGDMRELPLNLAKSIYRSQYWDAVRGDELPADVRYYVFDAAAASGVRQSILWLQRALGVAADGVLGPVTLAAANAANPGRLKARLLSQRLRFMAGLSNWPSFSRGWSRRVADLLEA